MTAGDSTTRVVSDSGNDIGPGQRLREAREAAQLTLGEVASRMRLEPQMLELLENDRYERLHGPTFVRGYLSGYARLLNLPVRPILEAYERHDHRPPALVSELGRKPEVHVSDFPVRLVTYVIAGLLVVLVVLWWQSRQLYTGPTEQAAAAPRSMSQDTGSPPPAMPPAPEPTAELPPPAPEQQPAPVPAAAEPMPSAAGETAPTGDRVPSPVAGAAAEAVPAASPAEPPASGNALGTPSDVATDKTVEVPVETPDAGNQSVAAPVDAPAPRGTDALAETQSPAADSETEPPAQPPRPAPLPGSDRLAIQLERESWVEIYDRGGGRLYYSLAQEGTEVVVEGAGPMQVLLGDVEGAAVAYNGEPFDLSRYQGRSVVRFTVGELSSGAAADTPPPPAPEEPLTRTPGEPTGGRGDAVADARKALVAPALPAPPPPAAGTAGEPAAGAARAAQPDS